MNISKYDLLAQGVYAEVMTPRADLLQLARRLRPVKTEFELIRFGSANDGGYLLPNDFAGISTCFSPGVENNAEFENDLKRRTGIESHLADFSVDAAPPSFIPLSFTKKFLGPLDNSRYMTLETWVSSLRDSGGDLILQMDIEGGEYLTLLATSQKILEKFRLIVIEFHDVESWGQRHFFNVVEACFTKILSSFYVLHNHPNNCCGIVNLGGFAAPRVFELTFIRKDRATPIVYCDEFPHPADSPNLPQHTDISLPPVWRFSGSSRALFQLPPEWEFIRSASGVLHVGASTGQERDLYDTLGLRVAWVEPIPQVFEKLEDHIAGYPLQIAINCLITDQPGKTYKLHISNNGGESSSIYELAQHRDLWPEVEIINTIELMSTSIDSLIDENKVDPTLYDTLVIDVQGAELLVLRGGLKALKGFRFLKLKAANFPAYSGGCTDDEIAGFLLGLGFQELGRWKFAGKSGIGEYFELLFVNPAQQIT